MFRLCMFLLFLITLYPDGRTQCFEDRHNTSLSASWLSCNADLNPVVERSLSHWIMYEFNEVNTIQGIKVWNMNHPLHLYNGVRELAIDYSEDGATWHALGTYELEQAPGSSFYEGQSIDGIEDVKGKFFVFTSLSNYGSGCHGLSEVKFFLSGVTTSTKDVTNDWRIETYPNPFSNEVSVRIEGLPGPTRWMVSDALGRMVMESVAENRNDGLTFRIPGKQLENGTYFLTVATPEGSKTVKLVVLHPKNW